jgi:hypothetical protein
VPLLRVRVEHGLVEISPHKIYKSKWKAYECACPRSVSQVAHSLDAGPHDAFRFEPVLQQPAVSVNIFYITSLQERFVGPLNIAITWLNSQQFS